MFKYFTCIIFIFFSANVFSQEESYLVQNTTISVVGSGKLKDWKPTLANVDLGGKFTVKDHVLETISDLQIKFAIHDSLLKKSKIANSIKKILIKNEVDQVSFTQLNSMILPLMKMAHCTMDVNIKAGNYYSPLVLNYKLEDNQTISITGKQTIWLYQLGILPKDIKETHTSDKIVLDINFSLIKSANMIAKSE